MLSNSVWPFCIHSTKTELSLASNILAQKNVILTLVRFRSMQNVVVVSPASLKYQNE